MKKILAYVLLIIGSAALIFGGYQFKERYEEEKDLVERSESALEILQGLIPERKHVSVYDDGKDSLMPVIEVNGLQLVGYVEIPETGDMFVIQSEYGDPAVSKMRDGNIACGTGVIDTDRIGFDEIGIGMTVRFTDVDGYVYEFTADNICDERDIVTGAKLILYVKGMSRKIQIACIEK